MMLQDLNTELNLTQMAVGDQLVGQRDTSHSSSHSGKCDQCI